MNWLKTPIALTLTVSVVIGFAVIAAVGFAIEGTTRGDDPVTPETLSPGQVAQSFGPGVPWDGSGRGNTTIDELLADTAQPEPLLWLGPQFRGYNLQGVTYNKYQGPDGRAVDAVIFIYGSCVLSEGDRPTCTPPVQLRLDQICHALPGEVAGPVTMERLSLRGVEAVQFRDGHFALWSGRRLISVTAPGQPDLAEDAVSSLRSIDGAATVAPGAALPPADTSGCR